MRKFIAKLRLYNSLPPEMRHKIVKELEGMDSVALDDFPRLVDKYVGIFTSNA